MNLRFTGVLFASIIGAIWGYFGVGLGYGGFLPATILVWVPAWVLGDVLDNVIGSLRSLGITVSDDVSLIVFRLIMVLLGVVEGNLAWWLIRAIRRRLSGDAEERHVRQPEP